MGVVPSFRTVTPSSGLLSPDEAPRQRGEHHVLAGHLPRAVGAPPRVKVKERGPSADFADGSCLSALFWGKAAHETASKAIPKRAHNGVSVGTRKCQSVACW